MLGRRPPTMTRVAPNAWCAVIDSGTMSCATTFLGIEARKRMSNTLGSATLGVSDEPSLGRPICFAGPARRPRRRALRHARDARATAQHATRSRERATPPRTACDAHRGATRCEGRYSLSHHLNFRCRAGKGLLLSARGPKAIVHDRPDASCPFIRFASSQGKQSRNK